MKVALQRWFAPLALSLAVAASAPAAWAGPGAHGPGGEHLDGPVSTSLLGAAPRLEARTELFELVARRDAEGLAIFVDRYDTNEPVLGATLEVESGNAKAIAQFRVESGDYLVSDKTLLAVIDVAGDHPLVFAVTAGPDADLLEGRLRVTAPQSQGGSRFATPRAVVVAVLVAGAALLAIAFARARRRSSRSAASFVGVILLLMAAGPAWPGPGAHGPGGEHLDGPGPPSASGLARLPDGSVNVPKASQRRMAVRTVVPVVSEAAETILLPGRVLPDPNAGGRVQASHGGRLEAGPKGFPVPGQAVKRGEVLAFTRHHADPFATAAQQGQLAELRANRVLADQRVKRLEELEGSVPRKEIEAARAEVESLREREGRYASSLEAREALAAPVDGVVARAEAIAGQVVEPGHVLFEIVDPRRWVVEATAGDPALALRIGDAAIEGVPAASLKLLGAARSLRDGVVPVSFSATTARAGEGLPLAVGQSVTVIATLRNRVQGIVLPAEAVVRSPANEPIVWIKAGAERFLAQPVRYQPLDARTVVVTAGLSADNRVVVQGAALIAQIR